MANSATCDALDHAACRGTGFQFSEAITGGSPSRDHFFDRGGCVRDLSKGPLGFPVVDVGVKLVRRLLSCRRLLRHGLRDRGPGRHARGHGAMQAASSRTGAEGRGRRAFRRYGARQRHRRPAPRPTPRLRRSPGLERAGCCRSDDPASRGPATSSSNCVRRRRVSARSRRNFDHLAELSGKLADQAIERAHVKAA